MSECKSEVVQLLDTVMDRRQSVRAYLPEPVDECLIREILAIAARAPSGANMQPWHVHVVQGAARERLTQAVCSAYDSQDRRYLPEYDYYPKEFFEPYLGRRRKVGFDLYALLGIRKGDSAAMRAQHRRNFVFFDAPVGLILTIDRRMSQGSWLDYGMFLQNIMLAARVRGLDTCPQAAWIDYHLVIKEVLALAETEQVVCGMALGYADDAAVENTLRTERAGLDVLASFHC